MKNHLFPSCINCLNSLNNIGIKNMYPLLTCLPECCTQSCLISLVAYREIIWHLCHQPKFEPCPQQENKGHDCMLLCSHFLMAHCRFELLEQVLKPLLVLFLVRLVTHCDIHFMPDFYFNDLLQNKPRSVIV